MKTLLIPALALALRSLSSLAQDTEASKPALPPPAAARGDLTTAVRETPPDSSPTLLRNPVQLKESTLQEVIQFLNTRLREQAAEPLNAILAPQVEKVKVPAITLQNVTAVDVLGVVARVAGLSVESVPSETGGIAAWIISRRRATPGVVSVFGGAEGGAVPLDPTGGQPGFASIPGAPTTTISVAGPAGGGGPAAGLWGDILVTTSKDTAARGGGLGGWEEPAPAPPVPATINRVLGVANIYDAIPSGEERKKHEGRLPDMLSKIAAEQNLKCNVRLYGELHVIVIQGSPEAVALVEQTVSALKENAGVKKPADLKNF